MRYIKKLFKSIRAFRWGKRLMLEYEERFRYFAVFQYSNDDEIGMTFAYDDKYFSVMHVEKIKTYNDFRIRASASYIASLNDKWEVKYEHRTL